MTLSNLLGKVKQRLQPVILAKLQANRASEIKQHTVAGIIHALVMGICLWIDTAAPLFIVTPFMIWFHYETAKEMMQGKKAFNLVMNNNYDFVWDVARIEPELKKLNKAEIKELFSLPLTSEQLERLRDDIKKEGFITQEDVAMIFMNEVWEQKNQEYVQEGNHKLREFLNEYDVETPQASVIAHNKSFNSKHVL